ncbi:MAG: IS66 family transposase [Planctomycetota bacterium]
MANSLRQWPCNYGWDSKNFNIFLPTIRFLLNILCGCTEPCQIKIYFFWSEQPEKVFSNITNSQAGHPAIQKIQDIFREKADRLYHWAGDRIIPADNNLAERELRPLVIAVKISFGSQSDAGA